MKTMIFKSALILGLCLPQIARAHGGGADGGGDTNVKLSSADQVSAAIDDALEKLRGYTFTVAFEYLRENEPSREYIRRLTRGAQPEQVLTITDGMDLKKFRALLKTVIIDKRSSGVCTRPDGTHVDASVDMSNPESPICFSIERLRRIPAPLLRSQALGLMVHEFMHKLGYGEREAQIIQGYITAEVATSRSNVRATMAGDLVELPEKIKWLEFNLKKGDRNMSCVLAKRVRSELGDIAGTFFHRIHEGFFSKEEARVAERFVNRIMALHRKTDVQLRGTVTDDGYGYGTNLHVDLAYCMNLATADQVRAFADEAQIVGAEILAAIPEIFRPGLTLDEGGMK